MRVFILSSSVGKRRTRTACHASDRPMRPRPSKRRAHPGRSECRTGRACVRACRRRPGIRCAAPGWRPSLDRCRRRRRSIFRSPPAPHKPTSLRTCATRPAVKSTAVAWYRGVDPVDAGKRHRVGTREVAQQETSMNGRQLRRVVRILTRQARAQARFVTLSGVRYDTDDIVLAVGHGQALVHQLRLRLDYAISRRWAPGSPPPPTRSRPALEPRCAGRCSIWPFGSVAAYRPAPRPRRTSRSVRCASSRPPM